jgi:hypothetical protein
MEWMTMQALRLRRGGKMGQTCHISDGWGGQTCPMCEGWGTMHALCLRHGVGWGRLALFLRLGGVGGQARPMSEGGGLCRFLPPPLHSGSLPQCLESSPEGRAV